MVFCGPGVVGLCVPIRACPWLPRALRCWCEVKTRSFLRLRRFLRVPPFFVERVARKKPRYQTRCILGGSCCNSDTVAATTAAQSVCAKAHRVVSVLPSFGLGLSGCLVGGCRGRGIAAHGVWGRRSALRRRA
eukprot:1662180-Prymnesium_polylepis.1